MSQNPGNEAEIARYEAGWDATMRRVLEGRSWSGHERNCAFLNPGGSRFADVSAVTGLDFHDDGRGVALIDWDHDGDLDLWLRNRTAPRLRLMLNGAGSGPAREFVALLPRGTTANRDAVGARVELRLRGEERPLLRTVYAGDGFRSQSSRWLHFGLGRDPQIESVSVRWPGGAKERFDGVRSGQRFVLVQGSGEAQSWSPPTRELRLEAAEQPTPGVSGRARIVLSRRFPRLALPYESFDGASREVDTGGRPLLLNLWASWCGPCVEELQTLEEEQSRLGQAGVDVLALTVEGLDSAGATTVDDARAMLKRVDFPFAAGVATETLLDKLELFQQALFARVPALGVPQSFLLDARGRIAVIYRGSVEVDQLTADLELLDREGRELLDTALPFEGRWRGSYQPAEMFLGDLADRFRPRYPADAVRFLHQALQFQQTRLQSGQLGLEQRQRLAVDRADTLFRLGLALAALGRPADAIRAYRDSVKLDPDRAEAHANLGASLVSVGEVDEAIRASRRALELDDGDPQPHNNLALALSLVGRFEEAIAEYEASLALAPDSEEVRYNLGATLAMTGRPAEAVPHFEHALRLDPDSVGALTDLAWIRATAADAALRDGAEALRLAQRAVELEGGDPTILDTLAAAYAEAQRFDEARATAERGLALAVAAGDAELAHYLRQRLDGYVRGRPYRETTP